MYLARLQRCLRPDADDDDDDDDENHDDDDDDENDAAAAAAADADDDDDDDLWCSMMLYCIYIRSGYVWIHCTHERVQPCFSVESLWNRHWDDSEQPAGV